MNKTTRTTRTVDDSTRVAADIVGVSVSLVQKVKQGVRNNDEVVAALVDYSQEKKRVIEKIKQIQEVYREAAKSGRYQDAYLLEEQIDALQAQFEEIKNRLVEEFYAAG
jgi:CTP-dependent riboflavin kinase